LPYEERMLVEPTQRDVRLSSDTVHSRAAASGSSAYAATPVKVPGSLRPASLQSSK